MVKKERLRREMAIGRFALIFLVFVAAVLFLGRNSDIAIFSGLDSGITGAAVGTEGLEVESISGRYFTAQSTCDVNISSCGYTSWVSGTNYCLDQNIQSTEGCFVINATNVTLDCLGNDVQFGTGEGDCIGISFVDSDNSTLKNCNIYYNNASIGTVQHGIVVNDSNKLYFDSVNVSTISHNFADDYALLLNGNSRNSTFVDCTFTYTGGTPSKGLKIQGSSTWNTFINTNIKEISDVDVAGTNADNYFIYNNSYGEIYWAKNDSSTSNTLQLGGDITIEDNLIEYLPSSSDAFNSSATIKINYGVDSSGYTPYLLRDGNRCDDTSECNISYSNGILEANVSHFSNYTVGHTQNITSDLTLTKDVICNETCFTIVSNDVVVDCQGYNITYGTEGIPERHAFEISGYDNVTIRNCNIVQTNTLGIYGHGIDIRNSQDSLIENNNVTTIADYSSGIYTYANVLENNFRNNNVRTSGLYAEGVYLNQVSYQLLENNTIITIGVGSEGIYINRQGRDNQIINNYINSTSDNCVEFATTSGYPYDNYFVNNEMYSTINRFKDISGGVPDNNYIIYNNSYGQIKWNLSDTATNIDLVVGETIYLEENNVGLITTAQVVNLDSPAEIEIRGLSHSSTPRLLKDGVRCDDTDECNITDYSGGILVADVSGFSNYTTYWVQDCGVINTSVILNGSVSSDGTCFTINASDVVLDCDGNTITYGNDGTGSAYGIYSGSDDNITIKNCNIVLGNTSGSSNYNMFVQGTYHSNIYNNNLTVSGGDSIPIYLNVDNNVTLYDNNIYAYGSYSPLYVAGVVNSTIRNNYLIATSGVVHGLRVIGDSYGNSFDNNSINSTANNGNCVRVVNSGLDCPYDNNFINNRLESNYATIYYDGCSNNYNQVTYNNSYGQIYWNVTNLTNVKNLIIDDTIFLQDNLVGKESLTIPGDNLDENFAEIEVRSLSYTSTPRLFKDGSRCDNTNECNISGYSAGVLSANVSGFSNYTTVWVQDCSYINSDANLTESISTSGSDCIIINASDITFDCRGYSITYSGSYADAIYNPGYDNVTIRNCNFIESASGTGYNVAIRFESVDNSTIENNNVSTASGDYNKGFRLVDSDNNIISNNNFDVTYSDNSQTIYLYNSSNNNVTGGVIVIDSSGFNTYNSNGVEMINNSQNNVIRDLRINTTASHGIEVGPTCDNNHMINNTIYFDNTNEIVGPQAGMNCIKVSSNNNYLLNNYLSAEHDATQEYALGINGNNTLFENNSIHGSSGTYALKLFGSASNNELLNNYLYGVNQIIADDSSNYNQFIYNNSLGQILWNNTGYYTYNNFVVGERLYLQSNLVGYNPYGAGDVKFNTSTQIEIKNLTYAITPELLKDGVRCDDTSACNISYDNVTGILSANVSGFSNYTAYAECDYLLTACKSSGWVAGATYCLDDNVSSSPSVNCMRVDVDNVTFDCKNYSLNSTPSRNYAVSNSTIITNSIITRWRNYAVSNSTIITNSIITPSRNYAVSNDGTITNLTVQNCEIVGYDAGVYLGSNTNNCVIENNIFRDNNYGVRLYRDPSNITIVNNEIYNSLEIGIELDSSLYNNITNNTITNSTTAEIYLTSNSDDNVINNNHLYGGVIGIYLDGPNGNNLNDNVINNMSDEGLYLEQITNSTIISNEINNTGDSGIYINDISSNNLTSNTITESGYHDLQYEASNVNYCNNVVESNTGSRNLPIKYYNGSVSLSGEELSELILCDADNSNINNVNISGSSSLNNNILRLIYVNDSNITNVISSDNQYGIRVENSNNIYLENNTANNNDYEGIDLYYCSNSNLINNVANNNSAGISISGDNNYGLNNEMNNNEYGLFLSGDNCEVISNTFSGNNYGLYVVSSSGNELISNTFSGDNYSIYLSSSSTNNEFVNNEINNSLIERISDQGTNYNTLVYNNSLGQVYWNRTDLSTNRSLIVGNGIYLSNNLVGYNSGNYSTDKLNSSAQIEIRSLTHSSAPELHKDGVRCDNTSECNITSYSGGILSADVSSFSNYTTYLYTPTPSGGSSGGGGSTAKDCRDGRDNDADGTCDYYGCTIKGVELPPDPGCLSPLDREEADCKFTEDCEIGFTCIDAICISNDYCEDDMDCGGRELREYVCQDGKYGREFIDYKCMEPGLTTSYCAYEKDVQIVEDCQFGCSDMGCLPGQPVVEETRDDNFAGGAIEQEIPIEKYEEEPTTMGMVTVGYISGIILLIPLLIFLTILGLKELSFSRLRKLNKMVEYFSSLGKSSIEISEEIMSRYKFSSSYIGLALYRLNSKGSLMTISHLNKAGLKELNNFILKEAKNGVNREELISELSGNGWNKNLIAPYVNANYPLRNLVGLKINEGFIMKWINGLKLMWEKV